MGPCYSSSKKKNITINFGRESQRELEKEINTTKIDTRRENSVFDFETISQEAIFEKIIRELPQAAKVTILDSVRKNLRELQAIEVLFVMGITSSMRPYLTQCKNTIHALKNNMKKTLPNCEISWGFLGYRESGSRNQFEILPFTEDHNKFHRFLDSVEPQGGCANMNNVTVAFEKIQSFAWTAQTRIVFYIAEAAYQEKEFCNDSESMSFSFSDLNKDHSKKKLENYVNKLQEKKVYLFLIEIQDRSSKMIETIMNAYGNKNSEQNHSNFGLKRIKYKEIDDNFFLNSVEEYIANSYRISRNDFRSNLRYVMQNSINENAFRKHLPRPSYDYNANNLTEENRKNHHHQALYREKNNLIVPKVVLDYLFNNFHENECKISNYSLKDFAWNAKQIYLQRQDKFSDKIRVYWDEFNNGSNRKVFFCRLNSTPNVLYVLKKYQNVKQTFDTARLDINCRLLAEYFAKEFSKLLTEAKNISLVENTVCQIGDEYFNLEEFLEGNFVKYNNNLEYYSQNLDEADQIAQTFSHWSFEFSKQKYLVHDLQGVGLRFTDIQITSCDKENNNFGVGNFGFDGLLAFVVQHKCNSYCKKLKLQNCARFFENL